MKIAGLEQPRFLKNTRLVARNSGSAWAIGQVVQAKRPKGEERGCCDKLFQNGRSAEKIWSASGSSFLFR